MFQIDDEYGVGEFPLPQMVEDVHHMEDLEDGSSVFAVGEPPLPENEMMERPTDFYENLAIYAKDAELNSLSQRLLKGIKEDSDAHSEWIQTIAIGEKYLGLKVEEFRNEPFINACAAVDPTLMTALVRSYATAKAELFPSKGPASSRIDGPKNEQAEQIAEDLKTFTNYYLTEIDKPYYDDSQKLLIYSLFQGTAFRKIYQDPILNRPLARMVKAQDLIVNPHCTSILESSRISYVMRLSRKDINIKQAIGEYKKIELPDVIEEKEIEDSAAEKELDAIQGIDRSGVENTSQFKLYESYVDLDVEDAELIDDQIDNPDGIPMPYIVTLCDSDRRIYAARRNWREGDATFARRNYFVQYSPLPGLGIYGIGLIQLIGNAAVVNTSLLRQSVDAATLANFPGGVKSEEVTGMDNNRACGPSEWLNVNTGGRNIREVMMSFGELYKGVNPAMLELRREMTEKASILASTGDTKVAETNANAPVGTTLALLEVENRMPSAILSNLHVALSTELQMLFELFQENFDQPFEFSVPGKSAVITKDHFNGQVKITPVSDPTVITATQRIIRAETELRFAESAPQLYDLREAHRRMQMAIGTDNIDALMPPPEEAKPMDPISENASAIMGKAIKASMEQDHEAHIATHSALLMDPSIQEQTKNAIMAHNQEHTAMNYLIKMQNAMGIQLPPPEALQQDMQLQNEVALKAAEATQQIMQELQQQMQQNQPVDPKAVLMLDIEQRKEQAELEAKAKAEQLEFDREKLEAETELRAFETQTKAEVELNKIEAKQDEVADKHDLELLKIDAMKHRSKGK